MASQSMRDWSREFAREIGLSADEVYGRQRALAESGLLLYEKRRGKGGGIAANPTNIARAMIAILFADRRSAVEHYGSHYINMPLLQSASNTLVHAKTFGEAIASLVANPESAENLSYIGCYRTHYGGEIGMRSRKTIYKTSFGYGDLEPPSFGILAWLDGASVYWSAKRYAENTGEQSAS